KRIRESGPLKGRLEDECKRADVDYHVPERNVATRWNSTIVMMNSAFPLRRAIDSLCDREPGLRKYKLTALQWDIVKQLQPLLKLFLDATNRMSESNTCLITDVIPIIDVLHDCLIRTAADTTKHCTVRHAAQRGIATINKYYSLTDESYV
ncbi:hypothetical protein BOTBODRAFT_78013, partial [Botryobasidium botryosum FD-172 SS1]